MGKQIKIKTRFWSLPPGKCLFWLFFLTLKMKRNLVKNDLAHYFLGSILFFIVNFALACVVRTRPYLLFFWNWTCKNIPDLQQCDRFQKSQKVIHHSTLVAIALSVRSKTVPTFYNMSKHDGGGPANNIFGYIDIAFNQINSHLWSIFLNLNLLFNIIFFEISIRL